MAKPIATNRGIPPQQRSPAVQGITPVPELAVKDLEFFKAPKGLDTLSPLSRVDREHSPSVLNLLLHKGHLLSRNALVAYGSKPSGPAEQTWLTADVEGSGNPFIPIVRYPLRWTTSRLWRFSAGDWVDTGVANHAIAPIFGVDFTSWRSAAGESLIVYSTGPLAGAPGLVEYNLPTAASRILAGSPTGKHVATFGNRVVVSAASGRLARVQWSVKDDDNDWAGLGSGFEDLLVATNDIYDEVMGVYPISDTTALIVREASIWRMDVTGFFDAPFQFTLLTDQLGTTARRTIRTITGGVVFLGYDDVYIVTLASVQRIGLPALGSVFFDPSFSALGSAGVASSLATSHGYFDHLNRRYWLNVKNLGTFVFSFDDQGWTRMPFAFEPLAIAQAYFQSGSGEYHGVYVTADTASAAFSLRDDPAQTTDDDPVGGAIGLVTSITLATGYVLVDSPLHKTDLVEIQLEYESAASQTLSFFYFRNGAYTLFGTVTVGVTASPQVLSVRKAIAGTNLQVALSSTTLGKLKIHSMHVFAKRGALIHA